jgi:hypothetical protein
MIVPQAFLSPAAILAPALTKASSARVDEGTESFATGSHDVSRIGLSCVRICVDHDDVEAS